MDIEYLLNILTVASLLIGGLIFIYQGFDYISITKNNKTKSAKLIVAGVLTIVLGFVSIIFGLVHYFIWMKKN